VETVLGLSLTSSSVGWAVLDGAGADPATLDHDVVDFAGGSTDDGDISNDDDISHHVAVLRGVQAIAAASGHDLTWIGVTWTDDAAPAANLVLKSLAGMGFDKVLPVRLAEAEALGSIEDQVMLARAAALAVLSNAETVPVPLLAVVPVRKPSWFASPVRAAALVAGLTALFVVGPELGGLPEPQSADAQPVFDSSATSVSIQAVPVTAPPTPVADAIQLVVGHPEPAARPRGVLVTAETTAVQAPVEQILPEAQVPVVVLSNDISNDVALVPAEVAPQPALAGPLPGPAPAPSPEAVPTSPAPDPAQVVMNPLLSALP
jgi:hypothetical protein